MCQIQKKTHLITKIQYRLKCICPQNNSNNSINYNKEDPEHSIEDLRHAPSVPENSSSPTLFFLGPRL